MILSLPVIPGFARQLSGTPEACVPSCPATRSSLCQKENMTVFITFRWARMAKPLKPLSQPMGIEG